MNGPIKRPFEQVGYNQAFFFIQTYPWHTSFALPTRKAASAKRQQRLILLLNGDYESKDIVPLMVETFEFIRDFQGEVPGASPKDCGNYLDMNLGMAKYLAKKFLNEVLYDIKPDRLIYPE